MAESLNALGDIGQ